jgi:hypothetical protein
MTGEGGRCASSFLLHIDVLCLRDLFLSCIFVHLCIQTPSHSAITLDSSFPSRFYARLYICVSVYSFASVLHAFCFFGSPLSSPTSTELTSSLFIYFRSLRSNCSFRKLDGSSNALRRSIVIEGRSEGYEDDFE